MGLKNNCYCTVWEKDGKIVDDKGKYAVVNISTSKKNKQTNQYETDFTGKVKFIGDAFSKVKDMTLANRDRLKLLSVETTVTKSNNYYTNFICWDCEYAGETKQIPKAPEVVGEMPKLEEIDEGSLPF